MIIVIADDITGAAEIAGIALHHSLNVRFITDIKASLPQADVVVIATDIRSGNETEAKNTIKTIANNIKTQDAVIFKKTDSALRGFIDTEINALMSAMAFTGALIIPQNPSKGRIIQDGIYYINGTPLEQTSFCYDPEFPATTSAVTERLPETKSLSVNEPLKNGICIADASTLEEIERQIEKTNGRTLVAGAADCFEAFLQRTIYSKKHGRHFVQQNHSPTTCRHAEHRTIIVCGSTQSKSIANEPYIKLIGAEETAMPYNVFHGSPADEWIDNLNRIYDDKNSVIMKTGHSATGGKEYAVRLRNIMAYATTRLVNSQVPDLLIIEGGATAFAVLKELGWKSFEIETEIAPGVVCMRYDTTHIILKPGSYSWGNLFKNDTLSLIVH